MAIINDIAFFITLIVFDGQRKFLILQAAQREALASEKALLFDEKNVLQQVKEIYLSL